MSATALAALVLAALVLPWAGGSPYVLHIGIMTLIFVVLAQSLNLVLGYSGLLSLATPAFFGVGAYTAALIALKLEWSGLATISAAALAGVLTSLVIGVPSLRVSRHSFVIMTLSATLLLQVIAGNWEDLTRGALGLPYIPAPRLFGFPIDSKVAWYNFALTFAAAAIIATHFIVSSPAGRAMIAARDNETLAKAVGIDVVRVRLFAFCVSGGFAGSAGALYAYYITFVDPGVFGFEFSEVLLIMVILGGAGTLWARYSASSPSLCCRRFCGLLPTRARSSTASSCSALFCSCRPGFYPGSAGSRGGARRRERHLARRGHYQGLSRRDRA
jgi:branched-chain amino acid transport system permease protein